ncbi:MAG TPA: hypothetical protein VKH46_14090 [Thermoanaerobaculia bacterium]|jgi:hypothetical protein|nr:hypothetical protein [Thermoanaerobaculia bacterium]
MAPRRSMAGTGRVGCVIWLALLAIGIFVASKVVPVKMKTSEFYDAMTEQAQFGSIKGDASIQAELFRKAQELQLPLKKDEIIVRRDMGYVYVEVHYKLPIEFPIYGTYVWKEDDKVSRPLFAT